MYELDEHFTLHETERDLLTNKTGATRLGFAFLFKYFQMDARFPSHKRNVPKLVVAHLAKQLGLSSEFYHQYCWQGRTFKYQRAQIREFLVVRESTVQDAQELATWHCQQILPHDHVFDHLEVVLFQERRVHNNEPPPPENVDRLIRLVIEETQRNNNQVIERFPV